MTDSPTYAFGLDAVGLDDRMRLFSFITAPERHDYLWVLRAIDRARANYQVVLSTEAVAQTLDELAERDGSCPRGGEVDLATRLDALDDWGVLDRTQDAARAATIAEYRRRYSVYQFTEAGHRAFAAVESVLGATMEETSLSRTVFRDLLEDLEQLAAANRIGDGDTVLRRFRRIDGSLNEVAEQAARFYAMLGDLTRTTEVDAAIFQAHKDALISHLRDFHNELQRYSPLLFEAATAVEESGIDRLVETAAEQDGRPFRTYSDRLADWRCRWEGVRAWLAPPSVELGSEVDRLSHATFNAISDITGMVRQLADARRGGVSRESQLRHLAAWFVNAPTMPAAHALFDAVFDLGGPLHVNRPYEEPEIHPTAASWWDTEAIELSRTLLEKGRSTGNRDTRGAKVKRDEAKQRLTKRVHSQLSGGEQSVALHLPLFAAANAVFGSAAAHAPRMVGLDEAFAGVDEKGRGELMSLAAEFDLQMVMTGYDLWATFPEVEGAAHYSLSHDEATATVSAMLMVWAGSENTESHDYDGSLAAALGSPGTRVVPNGE